MRLSSAEVGEEQAFETIAAATASRVTVFDTAHAYGQDDRDLGGNEQLLARALRAANAGTPRVVTKGGMQRVGKRWLPDGRAKTIRSDCEASLEALDGMPIDLYLLHAPDPRTPWRTSLNALAKLAEVGLVARVGLSNVNRRQLDEALDLAPISAIEVALNVFDGRALRAGLVERCNELGVTLIAHSPLGGPRRKEALVRDATLVELAKAKGVTPPQIALAWLLGLSPSLVTVAGARTAVSASSAAAAAALKLTPVEQAAIGDRFSARSVGPRRGRRTVKDAEVVVVMGIPGAGKTHIASDYSERGYLRLNRDERGGSLRELAETLDLEITAGADRVILDNTYLTRAARSYPIEVARRHGLSARCIWLDTPLPQAQINLVLRLLARMDALPTPEELKQMARREQGVLTPTSQMRAVRELEPPARDEGFDTIERRDFVREAATEGAGGVFVSARALERPNWKRTLSEVDPAPPHLIFDWRPGAAVEDLASAVDRAATRASGPVEAAICPHPAGPPTCWCRPPLPGLVLGFARKHRLAPTNSIVVGTSPAHRTLANALGAGYIES